VRHARLPAGARRDRTFAWRRFARNGGGALRTVGTGRSYTVARADRGQRVSCMVEAANAGGFVIAGAASRAVPRTL
jgi:hypothetical protein